MKEIDIRQRIHVFLRDTVRHVVVPASMGIGLALVGCGDTSLGLNPDGSADASSAQAGSVGGGAIAVYMAMAGMTGWGGATGAGGVPATGGRIGAGGATANGGATAGGGAPGTGGKTGRAKSQTD